MKSKAKILAGTAAAFWLLVGTRLIVMGVKSVIELSTVHELLIVAFVVVLVAYFKGVLMFGKLAKGNLVRLKQLEEPIPFYRLFSLKTYALIAFFAPMGILLGGNIDRPFYRALILLSVGTALFIGGLQYGRHWKSVFDEERSGG